MGSYCWFVLLVYFLLDNYLRIFWPLLTQVLLTRGSRLIFVYVQGIVFRRQLYLSLAAKSNFYSCGVNHHKEDIIFGKWCSSSSSAMMMDMWESQRTVAVEWFQQMSQELPQKLRAAMSQTATCQVMQYQTPNVEDTNECVKNTRTSPKRLRQGTNHTFAEICKIFPFYRRYNLKSFYMLNNFNITILICYELDEGDR